MSGREWKPGDVATIEVGCHANRHVGMFVDGGWRYGADKWADNDPAIVTARPLIVIDLAPEMDDVGGAVVAQWLREAAKVDGRRGILIGFAHLARQIEEQSAPPKPPEPTGLGAVVEDADGERWVRVNSRTGTAEWRDTGFNGLFRYWSGITAVRVLSEGVTR